jgi:hypothetical protein
MDNLQQLDLDVAAQILQCLSADQVRELRKVSPGLQATVSHLDTVANYWQDKIRARASAYPPPLQAFWLRILDDLVLLPSQWRHLSHKPHYSVGRLLPSELVMEYTSLAAPQPGVRQIEILEGIIRSDRVPLFQQWIAIYYEGRLRLAYDTTLASSSWNVFVYSVGRILASYDSLRNLDDALVVSVESPDIAHYMFVAQITHVTNMYPRLMERIIVYAADRLSYYLREVPHTPEVFTQELAILRRSFWTYCEPRTNYLKYPIPPTPGYYQFLSLIIDYSTDAELEEMIQVSPLTIDLSYDVPTFYQTLRIFCRHPRITTELLNEVLVPKVSTADLGKAELERVMKIINGNS